MERIEYVGNYDLTDKDAWAAVADRLKDKTPGMHGRVVLFCDPISTDGASKISGYENVLFHTRNHDPESGFGLIKLQGRSTGRVEQFRKDVEHYAKYYLSIKIIDLQMEKNETKIPKGTYQIRPNHYGGADNPLEARKIIDHYGLGFNLGNVVKYVLRCGKKDSRIQELRKAMTYLEFEIEKELADIDRASVPMTPKESVKTKAEPLFDYMDRAKVLDDASNLFKRVGHQAAIEQVVKEIKDLRKEVPVNYYKLNRLAFGLDFIKESFEKFKTQFEVYSESLNLDEKVVSEEAPKDVIPCAQKLANALDALGFKVDSIEEMITKLNEMKLLHIEHVNDVKQSEDLLSVNFGLPYVSGGFRFARLMCIDKRTDRWFVLTGPQDRMIFELGDTTITDITHSFKELYPKERFFFGVSNLTEVSSGRYILPSSIHDRDKEIENTGERV